MLLIDERVVISAQLTKQSYPFMLECEVVNDVVFLIDIVVPIDPADRHRNTVRRQKDIVHYEQSLQQLFTETQQPYKLVIKPFVLLNGDDTDRVLLE